MICDFNHLSPIKCVTPIDCKAWQKLGIKINGVYPIKPDSGPAFQVYFFKILLYLSSNRFTVI